MLSSSIQLNDHTPNGSDSKNSQLMEDLETGLLSHQSRPSNKKMKKRKQLDALLKFRPSSSRTSRANSRVSNDNLLSSEDDLFLPNQTTIMKKSYSSSYRRCCSYTRNILSFCFVCIFMIACVGLAYANIELKSEVQNLSSRVSEIEKRFSTLEINRVLTTIEQIKSRLNVIERWNVSYLYDRLHRLQNDFYQIQSKKNTIRPGSTEMSMNDEELSSKLDTMERKSKDFSDVAHELEKLSRDADTDYQKGKGMNRTHIEYLLEQERRINMHQDTNSLSKTMLLLNESFYANSARWQTEMSLLRKELQASNQSSKIQELNLHFSELVSLMQNSSNQTSVILTVLQSELDQIRTQMAACQCPKEPARLKPAVVESDQLQQSVVTKPTEKQAESNNTVDVAQIINAPVVTG